MCSLCSNNKYIFALVPFDFIHAAFSLIFEKKNKNKKVISLITRIYTIRFFFAQTLLKE